MILTASSMYSFKASATPQPKGSEQPPLYNFQDTPQPKGSPEYMVNFNETPQPKGGAPILFKTTPQPKG